LAQGGAKLRKETVSVAKQAKQQDKTDPHAELRERLLQQRQEIVDLYESDLRAGQEASGEETDDIVDRANNAYSRELTYSLSDGQRQTLLLLEQALTRLDKGTYGRCDSCRQEIGAARLAALPWARYCVQCQELAEQGMLDESHFD
jgi:DnaK suppressor protein